MQPNATWMAYDFEFETQVQQKQKAEEADVYDLIVFNDEVNTFDHVIHTLMDICGHTPEQAEQCTLLIHYKGKCTVSHGSFEEMTPMREAICRRGISAEIL